jgi:hypothetical protein
MKHVQETYRQGKKKDKKFKYSQAMKQAKKSYRGGNTAMPTNSSLGFMSVDSNAVSGGRRSRRQSRQRRQSRRR